MESAKKELQNIFNYYSENVSVKVAKKLVQGIAISTKKLENHPKIGKKEELLEDRKQEFRYISFKNYKIIYWINSERHRIEICDIFDMRQNPVRILRNK